MLIYNCKIKIVSNSDIEKGFVSIKRGIIDNVGDMDNIAEKISSSDINAEGHTLMPGFIDSHCHVGVFGDGQGNEAVDANEVTDPLTPHLSALDAVNPADRCFHEALMGGVTTVITGVGSANAIGGSLIAIKTYGGFKIDNRVIQSPLAIKMALGENPKTCYRDRDESPTTRMATAAAIREQLAKATRYLKDINAYNESKEPGYDGGDLTLPEYDAKNEALLPLLKKKIKAHIHCHRADDIFTAIRICKEYDIEYVLVHATESGAIADELLGENCIIGPVICDRSKLELNNMNISTSGILNKIGVKIAICTDHPVTPVQYLPLCAGIAIRGGLDHDAALRAITLNAAEICGISNRVGSIEKGKDADLLLFKGNFYDVLETPSLIIAGGKIIRNEV
ncbi:MAG: amidohydrolase family protein [Eubacterium sp.]|jgi:imidazolonepropionase-like amidohydrolase|nr:amidohydrolase family protein [Eubacterium sp.]